MFPGSPQGEECEWSKTEMIPFKDDAVNVKLNMKSVATLNILVVSFDSRMNWESNSINQSLIVKN
jgi:hypothetical protein